MFNRNITIKHSKLNIYGVYADIHIDYVKEFVYLQNTDLISASEWRINMADDRRKYVRLPIDCRLKVNNLYNGYQKGVDRINAEIVVFDISKGGIGFTCNEELPTETYFDATIGLNERAEAPSVRPLAPSRMRTSPPINNNTFMRIIHYKSGQIYNKELKISEAEVMNVQNSPIMPIKRALRRPSQAMERIKFELKC